MGRTPCCSRVGLHRGSWSAKEDELLTKYILEHGEGKWRSLPEKAGLLRCGKSCRLRWKNYLCPGIKRGDITPDEEDLIIRLHALLGNRWSLIAGRLPSRTDNEIKNHWNTHLAKRLPNKVKTGPKSPLSGDKIINVHKSPKESNKSTTATQEDSSDSTESSNGKTKSNKEKIKVHVPKPIRVLPRVLSSTSCTNIINNNHQSVDVGYSVTSSSTPEEVNNNKEAAAAAALVLKKSHFDAKPNNNKTSAASTHHQVSSLSTFSSLIELGDANYYSNYNNNNISELISNKHDHHHHHHLLVPEGEFSFEDLLAGTALPPPLQTSEVIPFHEFLPTSSNFMLENIYDEYLQLL